MWRCSACDFDNDRAHDACEMCQAKAPPSWQCAECTYMDNPDDFLACEICGSARAPVEAQPRIPPIPPPVPAPVPVPQSAPHSTSAPPTPSGEELANAALAEARQEQMAKQHAALGKRFRSTYGDEIGESFDALAQTSDRADEMEASVQAWCKRVMEQNYLVKCGYQEQFRKKAFPREGFEVSQVHEWVCGAFGIDLDNLVLEHRAPTGGWLALTSNDHFVNAIQMLRPNNSSEPFSLTMRASHQRSSNTTEPATEPTTEVGLPEYDATHATQFLMLGLDGEEEHDGPHARESDGCLEPEPTTLPPLPSSANGVAEQATSEPIIWENGTQCRQCASTFGYVFTRRHHCRSCFGSFCGYCATSFDQIEADGPKVRLCEECELIQIIQECEECEPFPTDSNHKLIQ